MRAKSGPFVPCLLMLLSLPVTAADHKPNVLFIAVDDLNDWVSCLGGHPQCRTPNIDRLAAMGTLFTNAHCAAPACNPSRAALFTGILPSTSGVYENPQPWRPAMPDAVTLPQHFMAHGYWAGGSGKMFHGAYPDPASWNTYFPSLTRQRPTDPLPANRPLNGIPRTSHFDWGPVDTTDEKMSDSQVADWVIGQLGREFDKPFFLACGMYRPHLPWYVPPRYFDAFPLDNIRLPETRPDDLSDIPPAGIRMAKPDGDHARVLKYNQWKPAVQGYLASIAFADAQIGRVLDALEASPHAKNTIVVFWTDHGWHLGEKQHWRKFALWEEATRTPLIFVVPPGISALQAGTVPNSRTASPAGLIDIYPTLVELCGLSANAALEGHSLMPQLRDPTEIRQHPVLTTHGRNNHALRDVRFRYIRYANGDEELYDHASDPMEFTNLAARPEFADVRQRFESLLPETNAPAARLDAAVRKRRQAKQRQRPRKEPKPPPEVLP